MEIGYVSTKGQLLIPAKLRKKFGIKPGTRINFYEENNGIRIVPITPETIDNNKGFMGTEGKLLKALMKEKSKQRDK
jgi:AbrB family looped-hinge helix DNA binding protein